MIPQPKISAQQVLKQDRMATVLSRLEQGVTTAARLAATIGTSERTVYRYVDELRAAGEPIIGEQGFGYMLRRRNR